ncbi:MAG: thioesterase family protein [Deltaproteobacteria bacterium]|nr:thioesterase family protein [Deltaproteobacteria bacterium]
MNSRREIDEILEIIHDLIIEKIPFNKVLGLTVESLNLDQASVRLPMREELIGNFIRGSLHGGVISSTLDFMGGLVAFLSVLKTMQGQSVQAMAERFAKIGTIDMRIDYLRPGVGDYFIATGYVLRTGNKVAVTRMELHNHERQLIAVGTGAYVVA